MFSAKMSTTNISMCAGRSQITVRCTGGRTVTRRHPNSQYIREQTVCFDNFTKQTVSSEIKEDSSASDNIISTNVTSTISPVEHPSVCETLHAVTNHGNSFDIYDAFSDKFIVKPTRGESSTAYVSSAASNENNSKMVNKKLMVRKTVQKGKKSTELTTSSKKNTLGDTDNLSVGIKTKVKVSNKTQTKNAERERILKPVTILDENDNEKIQTGIEIKSACKQIEKKGGNFKRKVKPKLKQKLSPTTATVTASKPGEKVCDKNKSTDKVKNINKEYEHNGTTQNKHTISDTSCAKKVKRKPKRKRSNSTLSKSSHSNGSNERRPQSRNQHKRDRSYSRDRCRSDRSYSSGKCRRKRLYSSDTNTSHSKDLHSSERSFSRDKHSRSPGCRKRSYPRDCNLSHRYSRSNSRSPFSRSDSFQSFDSLSSYSDDHLDRSEYMDEIDRYADGQEEYAQYQRYNYGHYAPYPYVYSQYRSSQFSTYPDHRNSSYSEQFYRQSRRRSYSRESSVTEYCSSCDSSRSRSRSHRRRSSRSTSRRMRSLSSSRKVGSSGSRSRSRCRRTCSSVSHTNNIRANKSRSHSGEQKSSNSLDNSDERSQKTHSNNANTLPQRYFEKSHAPQSYTPSSQKHKGEKCSREKAEKPKTNINHIDKTSKTDTKVKLLNSDKSNTTTKGTRTATLSDNSNSKIDKNVGTTKGTKPFTLSNNSNRKIDKKISVKSNPGTAKEKTALSKIIIEISDSESDPEVVVCQTTGNGTCVSERKIEKQKTNQTVTSVPVPDSDKTDANLSSQQSCSNKTKIQDVLKQQKLEKVTKNATNMTNRLPRIISWPSNNVKGESSAKKKKKNLTKNIVQDNKKTNEHEPTHERQTISVRQITPPREINVISDRQITPPREINVISDRHSETTPDRKKYLMFLHEIGKDLQNIWKDYFLHGW